MTYDIFFFKEKNRVFDIENFFEYLLNKQFIEQSDSKDELTLRYNHPNFHYSIFFHFPKVSKVTDLYRLSPKFFDLSFYLEIDPMMPSFIFNQILLLVKDITIQFNLYLYNSMFEDVTAFDQGILLKSYKIMRNYLYTNNQEKYNHLIVFPEKKLNEILRYLQDRQKLEEYYAQSNILFPQQRLLYAKETNRLYMAIDLPQNQAILFPPQTDLVFCHHGQYIEIVYYNEIIEVIEKYVSDLPGFIQNTKLMNPKMLKKARKAITKAKFSLINNSYDIIDIERLIDLE